MPVTVGGTVTGVRISVDNPRVDVPVAPCGITLLQVNALRAGHVSLSTHVNVTGTGAQSGRAFLHVPTS